MATQAVALSADDFNERFTTGEQVLYTDDLGNETLTNLRSNAWELGHGEAVVMIAGKSGGVSIDRISAVPAKG